MDDKLLSLRRKVIVEAIKKASEHFPLNYALLCYDKDSGLFHVVVKFPEKPSLYAADMHDYIYTRFGMDPRFYVVNSLEPLTKVKMLEECELVVGSADEVSSDLEIAKEEARRFEENLKDVARLYGTLRNG
ncbi:MAG: hypothetical protein GXO07_04530 [Crenarchaeota archaeon]|nr:hypothetical protein [Thermoproteota archaeon]